MKTRLSVSISWLLACVVNGQEFNKVEYLCCDWGPAMTLPTKTNEVAQFNDAEDEVYFLKQVTSFTRKKRMGKDLFSGRDYEDIGKGLSIWLCKMKPDSSGKTEIKELWKNPAYPIDTQAQSTWMDVNQKTRKVALSITFAGSDITGLWTLNLDGSSLKRIIKPGMIDGCLQAIDCPSWVPNGQWIVFGESLRGGKENWGRISKCDQEGRNLVRLSGGPVNCQPHVSPNGDKIVFIVISTSQGGLWIMDVDGKNAHPVPNPDDKRKNRHGGSYPAWSPDGSNILITGITGTIVDAKTGKVVLLGQPKIKGRTYTYGWPQWGRFGFVGFTVAGILVSDLKLKEASLIGASHTVEGKGEMHKDSRW